MPCEKRHRQEGGLTTSSPEAKEPIKNPGGPVVALNADPVTEENEPAGSTGFNGVGKMIPPNSSMGAHALIEGMTEPETDNKKAPPNGKVFHKTMDSGPVCIP